MSKNSRVRSSLELESCGRRLGIIDKELLMNGIKRFASCRIRVWSCLEEEGLISEKGRR